MEGLHPRIDRGQAVNGWVGESFRQDDSAVVNQLLRQAGETFQYQVCGSQPGAIPLGNAEANRYFEVHLKCFLQHSVHRLNHVISLVVAGLGSMWLDAKCLYRDRK